MNAMSTRKANMREYIGQCYICGRSIYCENGFLNGFTDDEGRLSCYEGEHAEEEQEQEQASLN